MTHASRTNALLQRFENDGVALSVLENTYSPTIAEFYADLGVDVVWIDLEHGGPSPFRAADIDGLLRAVDGTDTELLVRLPGTDPGMVRKALDAGVRNVFLPRVGTADEVRAAVEAGRFEYDGEPGTRGLAAPRARRWGLAEEYVRTEDAEVLVGATIETAAAVENIERILSVPELGFVFIGPLDLSVSLGRPGEYDHPDVREAIETVRAAAIDARVPVGGLGFGMDDVNEKATNGYQLLNLGSTTGALKSTVTGWFDAYDGERSSPE